MCRIGTMIYYMIYIIWKEMLKYMFDPIAINLVYYKYAKWTDVSSL